MLEHMVYEYYLLNPGSQAAEDLRQEIIDLSIAWGVMCEFTHFEDGGEVSNDEEIATEVPNLTAKLLGNYPNPFNPSTTIKFEVYKQITDRAIVKIYNVRGQGIYEINWDGTDKNLRGVASGTYFYTINVDSNILASKMVLLK
ncbi:MAG: T9SS type A sorting domain-containing protein [Candidatus Zophobacter franzmannii]|nr:T9SS type A sorting domain-containing protein [Candidatus Zophobacter franzmannii]